MYEIELWIGQSLCTLLATVTNNDVSNNVKKP